MVLGGQQMSSGWKASRHDPGIVAWALVAVTR
jgi:hypothetical protein